MYLINLLQFNLRVSFSFSTLKKILENKARAVGSSLFTRPRIILLMNVYSIYLFLYATYVMFSPIAT